MKTDTSDMDTCTHEQHHMPDEDDEDVCVGDFDEFMGEDEDIDIVDDGSARDEETNRFDQIVGALEDVLMDPEFEDARETFCRSHCGVFEDNDENKLIYTDVFSRYTELVEGSIEKRLKEAVQDFDMQKFLIMLDARKDELMSEVFDLLLSLGDFESFKEVMLSYKLELSQDASSAMQIHCSAMRLYSEEQEDGDERPDLDFGLTISPVGPGPTNKRF
ncbi:hypothetical protein CEUSTIGMA_g8565.t1 [Chlamydomonas eustigma]|uniref:ADP-ribosylation factor-like protein 2-binding protein n=1 Tax=Chlamydomonas eustigma TaxID=1157962 RepID=A0A250XDJ5_9CHLO|nr:hypothetical protein CEUSTIGMA_g8565.t1 [Chlamydomonas eustigma]|eukprot:GAX81131.1 hypothetical protein CEUSTIGMA_g8565.t1 [Chlamydomonas eustigma]